MEIKLRPALDSDRPAITQLIDRSVRILQAGDYSPAQIEGALGTVFGVDTQLLADGTYYVAESATGELAGCGGWSKRKTLFGSDRASVREPELLDPIQDAAKIRAFFIDPGWARQGIGTLILEECERAALAAGFRRFEMGATLTGVKLYEKRGYVPTGQIEVELANGARLPIVRMEKSAAG